MRRARGSALLLLVVVGASGGILACSLIGLEGYSGPADAPDAQDDADPSHEGAADAGPPTTVLASGLQNPLAIAIDNENVYFTTYFNGGGVYGCAKDGCGGAPSVIAAGENGPIAVAAAGRRIFWSDLDGNAIRCRGLAADAGPAGNVAGAIAASMAFGGDRLFFGDSSN